MNSEFHEGLASNDLPLPEVAQQRYSDDAAHEHAPTTETRGAKAVEIPQGGGQPDPVMTGGIPVAMPAAPTAATQTASTSTPGIADDNDLIEKEWVLKAKAIVAQHKDDPYVQNKQMSHYKADYIKKRFNKDVKVSE